MLKIAYGAGVRRALQDSGLVKAAGNVSGDISPEALAAIGVIPVLGTPVAAAAAGYYAPSGRTLSRMGHSLAGSLLGEAGGVLAGGFGGAGLGALLAHIQDEDAIEYAGKGALLGALLGGVGGSVYGRYTGQKRSQDQDARRSR